MLPLLSSKWEKILISYCRWRLFEQIKLLLGTFIVKQEKNFEALVDGKVRKKLLMLRKVED